MMSLHTAELVLFDEEEDELVMELFSNSQGKPCDFVIGVEENAHIFEFLEDLGELE